MTIPNPFTSGLIARSALCAAALYSVSTADLPKMTFEAGELGRVLFKFPEVTGKTDRAEVGRAEDGIPVNGHLVYTGLGSTFTWVWDISNPREPKLAGKLPWAGNTQTRWARRPFFRLRPNPRRKISRGWSSGPKGASCAIWKSAGSSPSLPLPEPRRRRGQYSH